MTKKNNNKIDVIALLNSPTTQEAVRGLFAVLVTTAPFWGVPVFRPIAYQIDKAYPNTGLLFDSMITAGMVSQLALSIGGVLTQMMKAAGPLVTAAMAAGA